MEKIVTVLASDFENNDYFNTSENMDGCPLQRAFIRAGLIEEGESYMKHFTFRSVDAKVFDMFRGEEDKKDLQFLVITNENGNPHECVFEGQGEYADL